MSSEKSKISRLFLGSFLNIEGLYEDSFQEKIQKHLGCPLKFVPKQNIHLTWKFLGETENKFIPKIIEVIEKSLSKIPTSKQKGFSDLNKSQVFEENAISEKRNTNQLPTYYNISISFDRFEIWPNERFPRQLVITGKDLNENATEFYENLNNKFQKFGMKKEKRKFNPHITVARFKFKKRPENKICLPDWLKSEKETSYAKADFNKIVLINSLLTPNGSIYKPIKSFTLHSK